MVSCSTLYDELSVRLCTNTGQAMPKDALKKIANCLILLEMYGSTFDFSLVNTANMNEAPIWAAKTSETIVVQRGLKAIPVKSGGF